MEGNNLAKKKVVDLTQRRLMRKLPNSHNSTGFK
jgi:hypothetical protein